MMFSDARWGAPTLHSLRAPGVLVLSRCCGLLDTCRTLHGREPLFFVNKTLQVTDLNVDFVRQVSGGVRGASPRRGRTARFLPRRIERSIPRQGRLTLPGLSKDPRSTLRGIG